MLAPTTIAVAFQALALFADSAQAILESPANQVPLVSDSDGVGNTAKRPNVVFILTDDQDAQMQSLDYMPLLKEHLLEKGTSYKRHYCTTAICCPARVTIWTGRAAHNTNVTDVSPPHGGFPKFLSQGLNERYLPVWLQDEGYNTYYAGKLFNAHTTDNYKSPHAAGWNGSDFLLDPFTYSYMNSTYQRNRDPPVSYEGSYTTDVLAEKALGFLDEAASFDEPFFLGISPIAPHINVWENAAVDDAANGGVRPMGELKDLVFTPAVPAERHKHLFEDVKVPRTENYNPDSPSGANWISQLPKLGEDSEELFDHYYRSRLRALQSVDELIEGVVDRLEELGILDNTYIIYTSDNGYHIGQHRLPPGKTCSIEEDINVPLIIRGPGVPQNHVTEIVTTHTDLAPTILGLIGGRDPFNAQFDGTPIPLTRQDLAEAGTDRQEHVNVEFWGIGVDEGRVHPTLESIFANNTYKALRIISESWDLYYSVWCTNEHELYDLKTDPGQLNNLLTLPSEDVASRTLSGYSLSKVVSRLDSLLLVLKTCKEEVCVRPWESLHPDGAVRSLNDALSAEFDKFYLEEQVKVSFDRCETGHLLDAEGPQFDTQGLVYRHGLPWSAWT
ncbi:alkaline-phosphatase-like protein [Poronia punctata]|nr:alkaline-phosphatase-like protein [Poronia punctata]